MMNERGIAILPTGNGVLECWSVGVLGRKDSGKRITPILHYSVFPDTPFSPQNAHAILLRTGVVDYRQQLPSPASSHEVVHLILCFRELIDFAFLLCGERIRISSRRQNPPVTQEITMSRTFAAVCSGRTS
jgi:hypothetical protein